MASMDVLTITGLVSVAAVVVVMFVLCKLKGGCDKPIC